MTFLDGFVYASHFGWFCSFILISHIHTIPCDHMALRCVVVWYFRKQTIFVESFAGFLRYFLVCFSWVSHAYTHFMYDFVASMCILYVTCRAQSLLLLVFFSCAPYRLFHFCPRWNKSQSNSKEQVTFGCRFKIDRVVHYNFHCDSFVYICIYYCDFVRTHTHQHQPTYTRWFVYINCQLFSLTG